MEVLLLNKHHDRSIFDCGEEPLNDYIKKYASQHAKTGISKTFVSINETAPKKILGFYSMCAGNISFNKVPSSLKLPKYPVPIIRIARLAVDVSVQK